jgi:hypothetical protein
MKIEQRNWLRASGWMMPQTEPLQEPAQLVLLFGGTAVLGEQGLVNEVQQRYPGAHLMGCSTAGEICGVHVNDDSLVATAVHFEHTRVQGGCIRLAQTRDSFHAGESLAQLLEPKGLAHVFVLSDGLAVNGSDLVRGLRAHLPESVTVTGGLAGDGGRFEKTLVFWDGPPAQDTVAIAGFYGPHLKVGCGSLGGWDPFGPERLITRSRGNVLYELDGHSAFELYKKYLGEQADGLPATGLLFPLSIRSQAGKSGVVRTILSINEQEQSMTFAGDIPEGSYARLMKANFDRLIDGADGAAKISNRAIAPSSAQLAILISCVGRKLVLRQRIEEEVEGVQRVLGPQAILTGFYSYGEISPFIPGAQCELHNQTMTITVFSENGCL